MPLPAVTVHFVGGALLLLGLATQLIAIPFMIEMIVAILSAKLSLFLGPRPCPCRRRRIFRQISAAA